MKTVQMTLEENLLREVDEAVERLATTRSAFTRDALRKALDRLRTQALEEQQKRGYERHPVVPTEFDDWESEQVWPN
jgi:metal-responsive CopG/Arc/MetJ family transcriptional regulator